MTSQGQILARQRHLVAVGLAHGLALLTAILEPDLHAPRRDPEAVCQLEAESLPHQRGHTFGRVS